MSNTFSGLEIGRRAMSYFRQGIETAGHNISNADVEGYSRQRVDASASTPYTAPGMNSGGDAGQIGTGVDIDAINRIRDSFLDFQYCQESIEGGFWEAASRTMEYLEMFIGEPSENGLSGALENVNQALQELQKRPDLSSTREAFVREMDNLCGLITHTYENMSEYRVSLDQEVELQVQEANDLIDRIASLNGEIEVIVGTGNTPNDLMDERDLLIQDLSRLIDISTSPSSDSGAVNVSLAGRLLVQEDLPRHLVLVPQEGNSGFYDVQVEGNEFESSTHPETASAAIGRDAVEGIYTLEVLRSATETRWAVGNSYDTGVADYADTALGIEGSFSLQVGTDGYKAVSSAVSGGVLLGNAGDPSYEGLTDYSFRITAGGEEQVINITWDDSVSQWSINGTDVGAEVDLSDLESSISGSLEASVDASGEKITFSSQDGYLVSLTDLEGDMVSSALGIEKSCPSVEIQVWETDSLQTIANKINGAYDAAEDSPDSPEEWLHATVEEARDGTFYLLLESNSVGESYRINVSSAKGGSLQTAKLLGLLNNDGTASNLEYSSDALVKVDGMEYLSSVNSFSEARLVTAYNSYRADTMQTVIKGVTLEIKEGSAGSSTDIRVERQVSGGFIEGLLQSRDNLVTDAMNFLNDFAMALSEQFNAMHYSGHGSGEYSRTTGVSIFEPLISLKDAASSISVNSDLLDDQNLLGASGDDGSGYSLGSGDGSRALGMLDLFSEPLFDGGSSTIDEYYTSFVSSLGSQSRQASVMYDNQQTLMEQISTQRQSISGVNIDEEMMDMVQFQQSYQAIARYITVLDEMLDQVINGMGIVGR